MRPNGVKVISTAEAVRNDYNLSQSRYVGVASEEVYQAIPDIVAELAEHQQKASKLGKDLARILKQMGVAG